MSLTSSHMAPTTLVSTNANLRPSSHKQKGKGSISLKTFGRLSLPPEIPRRRLNRRGSLKPASVEPVQTRNHTEAPAIHMKTRKREQHHTKEHYMKMVVSQQIEIEALRAQLSKRSYKCPKCPKSFKRSDNLRGHVRRIHPESASSLDETYCEKCEKRFTKPGYLTRHTCAPNSRGKYACLTCTTSILTRFLSVISSAARPYHCEQCRVDLSSSLAFNRHMKSEKHREVVGQSTNQDLGLVPQEGASSLKIVLA